MNTKDALELHILNLECTIKDLLEIIEHNKKNVEILHCQAQKLKRIIHEAESDDTKTAV